MTKTPYLLLLSLFCIPFISSAQEVKVYNLRNCQSEMRIATFGGQVNTFNWWVWGKTNLRDQRVFIFSTSYQLDSAYLTKQVQKIKDKLPTSFFRPHPFLGDWYDNVPDEPAIWFLQVYATKDKDGKFSALAAVKIVFEGKDARMDINRERAAIKDIAFIFDKKELAEIALKLQSSQPLL